ncbi:hypothetical protein As57867_006142, partial [Aphanomyces stellatus]
VQEQQPQPVADEIPTPHKRKQEDKENNVTLSRLQPPKKYLKTAGSGSASDPVSV